MGKKAMFSHLSVPPIPPFFPYLSLLSLLPLLLLFAFYPLPPLLLLCMYAAHRMKCSYGVFTKGSDFSRSWGEWGSVALVLVVIFQKLPSRAAISPHQPPTPPFFSIQDPHPFYVTAVTGVAAGCEDREQGGKTIDRVSILSGERLQRDKASVGREQARSLLW